MLVVAATFPSRIQPWLLSQIEQIYRRGGSVHIVADRQVGDSYPPAVDELGLLERTHYYPVFLLRHALGGLLRLILPTTRGRQGRAGLRRLRRSGWKPEGWKGWVKALVRAPVLQLRVDLVHAHSMSRAYEYRHVPAVLGIPMVLTFHGQTPKGVRSLDRGQRDRLFEGVDVVLANTEFARSQLEALGCPGHRIRILPQGIRLEKYRYRPRPRPDNGPVRLLSVCRFDEDKGLAYSLDGMKLLVDEGYDVEYTIVGGGPEEGRLERQAQSLGLAGRVHFTGWLTGAAVRDQYRGAHVFILPSVGNDLMEWGETQGMVIQEAQASGLIVTASRVGGIPECVDEGRSAFLFEDRNPGAISEAVAGVIDRPERWRQWQDAGRAWVEERFDIDVLGDRLWALYARILAEHQKRSRSSRTGAVSDGSATEHLQQVT